MSSSEPPNPAQEHDVLTNLPRSRRQRPSARREAARSSKSEAKPSSPIDLSAARAAAAPAPAPERRKSQVPRAGYATPNAGQSYGDADPAGLLTELTRAVLRFLPG